jgi:hypothetical protein
MQKLDDGMLLYHGSYIVVDVPNLTKCASKKDFGKGFYLTTSKKQAENFVRASIKKAIAQGLITQEQEYGFVSVFEYHKKNGISEYIYEDADVDWLHCIVGHRKKNMFADVVDDMMSYDIVGGKIADDRTNVVITTYLLGGYGAVGSAAADEACIAQLIPERLKDQYCFRTNEALECISFVESEKIWIN